MASIHELVSAVFLDLKRGWKSLFATDILYRIAAAILLVPLVALLFKLLVIASGRTVLADTDILFFFLRPIGWLTILAVGATGISIVALQMAALMAIIAGNKDEKPVSVRAALRFAMHNAVSILKLTGRLVAVTVLATLPFLAIGGIAYLALLTEFDINFYLSHQPPKFLVAVGIGAVLVIGLALLYVRLFSGWLFALPLVLFERIEPGEALRTSRQRADGHRKSIAGAIVIWALASFAISAISTGILTWIGRLVVPNATGTLPGLVLAVGLMLILLGAVNLIVSILSSTAFASMLVNVYAKLGTEQLDTSHIEPDSQPLLKGFRLTRMKLAIGTLLLAVASAVIGVLVMRSISFVDRTQVMAHRGASAAAPENTMAAVHQAIEDGSHWVEIDVQLTADNQVVIMHDQDFMKLSNNPLKIWDATMDDLATIDIGSYMSADFADERVPTLGQVLTACKDKVGVNIELKFYGNAKYPDGYDLVRSVAEVVEAHEMQSQIIVMSLHAPYVAAMKDLRPTWKVGRLAATSIGDGLLNEDVDFVAVNVGMATHSFVRAAHAQGKEIYVWTVNDDITMMTMMSRGVDAIITDEPKRARQVLAARKQMSSGERTLVELATFFGVKVRSPDTIDDF